MRDDFQSLPVHLSWDMTSAAAHLPFILSEIFRRHRRGPLVAILPEQVDALLAWAVEAMSRLYGCSTLQVVLAAEPQHFLPCSLPQADRCRPVAAVRRKQRPEFKAQLTVARHPGPVP